MLTTQSITPTGVPRPIRIDGKTVIVVECSDRYFRKILHVENQTHIASFSEIYCKECKKFHTVDCDDQGTVTRINHPKHQGHGDTME